MGLSRTARLLMEMSSQIVGTVPGKLTMPDGKVIHIKPAIGAETDEICFTRYSRKKD